MLNYPACWCLGISRAPEAVRNYRLQTIASAGLAGHLGTDQVCLQSKNDLITLSVKDAY